MKTPDLGGHFGRAPSPVDLGRLRLSVTVSESAANYMATFYPEGPLAMGSRELQQLTGLPVRAEIGNRSGRSSSARGERGDRHPAIEYHLPHHQRRLSGSRSLS